MWIRSSLAIFLQSLCIHDLRLRHCLKGPITILLGVRLRDFAKLIIFCSFIHGSFRRDPRIGSRFIFHIKRSIILCIIIVTKVAHTILMIQGRMTISSPKTRGMRSFVVQQGSQISWCDPSSPLAPRRSNIVRVTSFPGLLFYPPCIDVDRAGCTLHRGLVLMPNTTVLEIG